MKPELFEQINGTDKQQGTISSPTLQALSKISWNVKCFVVIMHYVMSLL